MSTLILYSYCEHQGGIIPNKDAKENLLFFLENGLIDNPKYVYCISVCGKYSINFEKYTNKYKNLILTKDTGKCSLDSFLHILSQLDNDKIQINNEIIKYENIDYFYFIADKVAGPYNCRQVSPNWIEFINKGIDKEDVIISAYGTSPLGKLYIFPYISIKFMCISKKVMNLIKNKQFFEQNTYNTRKANSHNNIGNIFEIKLSKFLMDNDISYATINRKGVGKHIFIDAYKKNDKNQLFTMVKNIHAHNDADMDQRIFWTGVSMRKVFHSNDKLRDKYRAEFKKKRNTNNLERW